MTSILAQQRQPFTALMVTCHGEQLPEPPVTFTSINLYYTLRGAVDRAKLERAIELSGTKYCSVLATLRPVVRVTSDFEIVAEPGSS